MNSINFEVADLPEILAFYYDVGETTGNLEWPLSSAELS
jgi:hypothetical protein